MAMSPFSARPLSPEGERRRARLVLAIATIGIAATLLAYAISPGVRHAVVHAAHSVKGAVNRVLDRDHDDHKTTRKPAPHSVTITVHRSPAAAHPPQQPVARRPV